MQSPPQPSRDTRGFREKCLAAHAEAVEAGLEGTAISLLVFFSSLGVQIGRAFVWCYNRVRGY